MSRTALAALCVVAVAACSKPVIKPVEVKPLEQTCSEVAKQLENGSGMTPADKKELVESLKPLTFHWKLRVLAVSDETSRGELAKGMVFDVECQDRPGNTEKTGLRYVFTLYFERRVAELAKLSKGAVLTVDGSFIKYEGQGAFSAQASAYAVEE